MPRKDEEKILGRLDEVERGQVRIADELDQLRRELRSHGLDVPELNPGGRTPLSPEAQASLFRRAAAKARAAKDVGEGKGCVKDPETATRMRAEALAILDGSNDPGTEEP